MTGSQQRLTGHIQVALPPSEAFRLFTPLGEQDWVPGWQPHFPAPAADDTEPGTVFETSAHGHHTIWLVTGRQPGERISYARVTPGGLAGSVTISISPTGHSGVDHDGMDHSAANHSAANHSAANHSAANHSEVEVSYCLTALTGHADDKLREFADGYPAYLQSWQDAIAAHLQATATIIG
jgi:hypothetical protein